MMGLVALWGGADGLREHPGVLSCAVKPFEEAADDAAEQLLRRHVDAESPAAPPPAATSGISEGIALIGPVTEAPKLSTLYNRSLGIVLIALELP